MSGLRQEYVRAKYDPTINELYADERPDPCRCLDLKHVATSRIVY